MGDNYNLRLNPSGTGRITILGKSAVALDTKESLFDTAWHQLSGTYDGAALNIYVDGKLSASMAQTGALEYSYFPRFVIGKHGNKKAGYEFIGSLDEVEVSGDVARSADWIKLGFENQRAGSVLLEFRP